MAGVVAFNYWLESTRTKRITENLISEIEKIVTEHHGEIAFPPITDDNFTHERTYEFKTGALFLKMLTGTPRQGPSKLKITVQGKAYEGRALAFVYGFHENNNNCDALVETLKTLSAKYYA